MKMNVGLGVEVLDFVDSWLQFSALEDGRVAGRAQGHGWWDKCDNVEGTSKSQCYYSRDISLESAVFWFTYVLQETQKKHLLASRE